jgi:hypothetical protein
MPGKSNRPSRTGDFGNDRFLGGKTLKSILFKTVAAVSLTIAVQSVFAKVSEEQVNRLGTDLTPLGAQTLGNAEGTIPAWTGGITTPPENYQPGQFHPDPFTSDPIAFTITKENTSNYRKNLTEGQVALLNQYAPGYKMHVYPSRRSAAYPQWIYEKLKANAATAEVLEQGNGVKEAIATSPFPIPQTGLEVIWNHILRFRGEQAEFRAAFVTPTKDGSYTPILTEYAYYFAYSEPGVALADIDNKIFYLRSKVLAPSKLAGTLTLVHETLDQVRSPRKAWRYETGTRRLRRTPNLEYSEDFPNSSGLKTIDQTDMYNGAPVQYEWTLMGKQEVYVPYNAYKLHSGNLKIQDIITPRHINQDLARYELHRVWIVEGKMRDGINHKYAKRRLFFDEDSWQILLSEEFDDKQKLWRVSEAHTINYYEVPVLWTTLETTYDLKEERYFADGLDNEEVPINFKPNLNPDDFSPNAARRETKR